MFAPLTDTPAGGCKTKHKEKYQCLRVLTTRREWDYGVNGVLIAAKTYIRLTLKHQIIVQCFKAFSIII